MRGDHPFYNQNVDVMFRKTMRNELDLEDEVWSGISSGAKDLLIKLMSSNPEARISPKEALAHSWIHHHHKEPKKKHKMSSELSLNP